MPLKVLRTGATGFVGAHVLRILVQQGHTVVAAVRSQAKHAQIEKSYLVSTVSTVLVPDITANGAFNDAVQSEPPFDAVIHTASPSHFKSTEYQKDILDLCSKECSGCENVKRT
ncbi:Putative NAD-dependent epimerase/dehydratase, NAD(P)-binding domain superfamily [Septoria linicola]|uniref:NAD-dependent epimerase/dehydratase, NAD(P)-binding domain superfamily n=1 Tax=Septoria linicola TaxID=215465 RepID=A0A9Q9AQE0_9PEZI|nr:putative NAD-dependent epimerase/dehydratase, NAD(P)-binding domain superfamily [Septoria linicola]USW50308.1 Putative NAD-dependent epimerase/dehydratase, NAD(P)-binding domain superfamily [Septoria linicola]